MTLQTGVASAQQASLTATERPAMPSPRIYAVHPLLAGPLKTWGPWLDRAAALGFTHILTAPVFAGPSVLLPADFDRPHPALGWDGPATEALHFLAGACRARGLTPLMEVGLSAVASGGRIAQQNGSLFRASESERSLDPRRYGAEADAALARWDDGAEALAGFWSHQISAWDNAGIAGYSLDLTGIPPAMLAPLIGRLRSETPSHLLGWTPGLPREALSALKGTGLDYVFSSLPWWDFKSDWLWAEAEALRQIAPAIALVEEPFGARLAGHVSDMTRLAATQRRLLRFAAAFGDGMLMPMGFEASAAQAMDPRRDIPAVLPLDASLAQEIKAANQPRLSGTPRLLSSPDAVSLAFIRSEADLRYAEDATLTVVNTDLGRGQAVVLGSFLASIGGRFVAEGLSPDSPLALDPGELRMIALKAQAIRLSERPPLAESGRIAAEEHRRIGIEAVSPTVDDGRFPAKRIAGETVTVEADIVCDGHDQLGVVLMWRLVGECDWSEARMRLLGNDRWQAVFPLQQVGLHEFAVEAWRDAYATFRDELSKKHNAGVDVRVEMIEGQHLIEMAGAPLASVARAFTQGDNAERIALLLSADVAAAMARADTRPFAVRSATFPVDADRAEARFANWYEIFPRSMSDDPTRHGTFADVERHLPRIRDMGFDVLYFPPIHPIGRSNRKGPNNTLDAGANDPGSPYAIGSADGGHDAIHPELGSLADFQHMRQAAAAHGMELALDFAIQCSPDHPWLSEHKRWFAWRPDGTIKYAENPPKKYQDIVNVDFYAEEAVPDLWVALANVVMFWAEQGIRIFRVDNPHTKPFPFWEWLIAEVRAKYPGTQFLAEAFTRPKIMNRLGKVGFTQSYTYFTWRNSRAELEEYLTTLTTEPVSDFFRPNFFVNTPDINPVFLQTSGRAGHLLRAALAATLSGLWGVYSGFELCDATPLPGREEYLDSEKYQIRAWDWNRPGNIVNEITMLNRIRRQNPALQTHLGITFLPSSNAQVMIYEKATPDRSNVVIVAANLDPHAYQSTAFELPLYKWSIPDQGRIGAADLVTGERFTWTGKWQRVNLDPSFPFALWRVQPEIV
ncbi:maltotransferase domain-containing protein [Acidisoma cladoniae]|uniref:maltotransferase domain-containing protein n=1 Tax=Acidisoma cladoniae TaxID=3040935 RepID=UPI00254F4175|nr:maltotransferase domain-containing protein [Acidisoma sp. PAMC 29798]